MGKSVFEECVKAVGVLHQKEQSCCSGICLGCHLDTSYMISFGRMLLGQDMLLRSCLWEGLGGLRPVLEKVEAVKCSYCCFCDIDLDEQQKMD